MADIDPDVAAPTEHPDTLLPEEEQYPLGVVPAPVRFLIPESGIPDGWVVAPPSEEFPGDDDRWMVKPDTPSP